MTATQNWIATSPDEYEAVLRALADLWTTEDGAVHGYFGNVCRWIVDDLLPELMGV